MTSEEEHDSLDKRTDRPSAVSPVGRPRLMAESVSAFEVDQLLRIDDDICRIKALHETDQGVTVELKHFETGAEKLIPLADLQQMRPGLDFSFIPQPQTTEDMLDLIARDDLTRSRILKLPLDDASFAQRRESAIRVRWLEVLKRKNYFEFRASELWDADILSMAHHNSLPVRSAGTLARWSSQEAHGGSGIVPKFDRRGGKGQSRIDGRAADVLGAVIFEARGPKSKIKLTPTSIQTAMNAQIATINAEAAQQETPGRVVVEASLSTVRRVLIASVSPYELAVAKFGKNRADRMFSPSARRPKVDFVAGMYEFDDVDTKVFCIDGRSKLPWGRPWISHGVDQVSSFPVGTNMDNKGRSAQSAREALVHSIEVKRMADYGPELAHLRWEAFGFPVGVLFDNALYNNFRIISLGADLADPSWAQPFQPKQKREIEYLNGQTVHDFLANEPGYRGALDDPDAISSGLKTAIWVVDRLKVRYLLWLIGAFSNRPMSDGFTPRQKYQELNQLSLRSRVPPDTRRLRLLQMASFPKKLTWGRGGIRVMGLTYQDVDQFKKWINRPGGSMEVEARISENDLKHLYISVPDSDFVLEIPCLQMDYVTGLTLYQQQLILKMCRQLKKSNPSLPDMYAAREALKKMTEQMMQSGKIRERKVSERTGDLPPTPAAASVTEAVHDLELECRQLALVEMDESEEGWSMPALV